MKEATVICPFEHIEVSEERYSKAIKKFRDSSLQVDQYGFFVAGGKWKVGWKKITQLLIDEQSIYISTVKGNDEADDDDPEENSSKKGLQVQARIADVRAPSEWPSFRRYVIKKWEKLQGRKRRIEDAIKEQAEEEARQARRAAVKPKRSRMERFVMKNLANMKTFDDESDDETFNRRNHKTLMAERKRQEETRPESQEPKDEAVSHDEEEEREPALDDEDSDSTATQPGDKKTPIVQQKARRLKRKSLLEEDSDDEGLFGGNPGVTDISTGRPVVTPGASLKKAAILDDDDDDDDEEKSNADIANVAPITNYFKPKVAAIPSTSVIAKQASSHKASEKPTTTKMTEKLVLATPLLPSKNKNDQKVAPANFFAPRLAKVALPTETPEGSEDDTVVATPPPKAPRTPPRSVYKHLYQSSASRMEQDDDQVMDYIDERHVSPRSHATTTPLGEQPNGTRLTKRKNYFGTKAPPGRGSAVFALDQADKSPAPRNIYEGLEFVSPSKQRTPASSPPRKRPTWESPLSLSSHKNDTPPAPSVSNSRFRGLRNLGNTCYINSSLQMLFSIPDFVQALNPFAHSRRLVESLCMTFQDVIHPFEGFAGPASAKKLKTALDSTTDKFRGYQQRDAHEFLGHLIDEVHEQIEQKRADDKEAEACGLDDLLPTDDFFRLNVEVNLKCKSCGYSRTKEEMYRYLSVDIGTTYSEDTAKPTVERCLESFFEPEDREIKCEMCEDGIEATQTLRILSRPRTLLIHLKRFAMVGTRTSGSDEMEIRFQKNKAAVELNDKLSLDGFLSDKATSSILSSEYSLRSIVHHIGNTADSGHYTADALRETIQNGQTVDQWVSYDDSTSIESNLDKIRSTPSNQKTAYMLLYST